MTTHSPLHIVGISGSLRKKSFNTALLQEAAKAAPDVEFTIADISAIPFFNEDIEGFPKPVTELKDLVLSADAIIIATPEYNGMIPGVLKNTLEWLSRPSLGTPLSGKPLGIMGATTAAFGGAAAQTQMRQLAFTLNMHVLNRPLVRIGNAGQKFDQNGTLIDEQAKEVVQQFMIALVEWTLKLKSPVLIPN